MRANILTGGTGLTSLVLWDCFLHRRTVEWIDTIDWAKSIILSRVYCIFIWPSFEECWLDAQDRFIIAWILVNISSVCGYLLTRLQLVSVLLQIQRSFDCVSSVQYLTTQITQSCQNGESFSFLWLFALPPLGMIATFGQFLQSCFVAIYCSSCLVLLVICPAMQNVLSYYKALSFIVHSCLDCPVT